MPDVFTKKKRSAVMAAIRSRSNKDTEMALLAVLRKNRIKGWRRHVDLPGRPDFTFRTQKVVVFVDGCFWHGCPLHGHIPKSNRTYWARKIKHNKSRDRAVGQRLRHAGWKVVRIWEHNLKYTDRVARRVEGALLMRSRRSISR
jgi:DNA mismatch endonuclease (patch repair protein)